MANVQYASIGSQVNVIDTIKYYNQSLLSLAKSTEWNLKNKYKKVLQKIIETNLIFSAASNSLSDENKEWIRDCLSDGKGVIPYIKKITWRLKLYLKMTFLTRLNSTVHLKMK